ncbi:MAG: VWA domain-containing protein [Anaerolineae bacterium]
MNRRRLVALLLPVALAVTVLGSRAAPAQTITPPIAYPHVATIGQTGQPYRRSDANLNQPVGLGADRDGVWIANGAGRNLLRFGLAGVESLGRAGALDALYGRPLRFLADVAVVNLWGGRPSPTATPRTGGGRVEPPTRTVWFVDQGGHVAVGLPPRDERFPAPPIVLGETDRLGDDDGHLRDPPDIAAVTAGLDRLTQASGTRIDLALDSVVAKLTGSARRAGNNPVIILLTDGEPTGTTTDAVQQAALRAKATGMLVFTIGLGQAVDEALLGSIASRPEWAYLAPDTSDLAGIYERIVYVIPCKPEWP